MPATEATVLVTGVTGFIGAEVARQLLAAGYRVRGTTRDVAKAERQGHLAGLPGAGERLELVEADLTTPHDFDAATRGCDYVMHVASPYALNVANALRDLVEPAVEGTISVLTAAAGAGTVRRVVLTSSFAAIMGEPGATVFTEADWNTWSSPDFGAYYYSKTVAEHAAWDFVEDRSPSYDLVAVNPVWVIGPSLVPTPNESHTLFTGATDGSQPGIIALDHPFVDVRDVGRAHLAAMETPSAHGRYLTAAGNTGIGGSWRSVGSSGWGRDTACRASGSTTRSAWP
jgi:dihydroflavonol-4-reductase